MSEQEQEHWFNVGKSAGLEYAAERLMEASLAAYKRGLDENASLLRGHAKHLFAQAQEVHPRKVDGSLRLS